jgi:hypothetical protein
MEDNSSEKRRNNDPYFLKDKYVRKIEWEKDGDNESKKEKLNFPKRKYAIIHGYFGHDFKGNQK